MTLRHTGALLRLLPILWLTACNSDSAPSTSQTAEQQFLRQHAGQYSGALVRDGQAQQLRLAIHDLGAELTHLDERDHIETVKGAVDDSGLTFDADSHCTVQASGFSCALAGQTVTLEPLTSESAPDLATLAGDYHLVHGDDIGTLKLDSSGVITAKLQDCEVQATLSTQDTQLVLQVTGSSCDSSKSVGIVIPGTLTRSNDSLEVWIPDSSLSGFWLR